MPIKADRDWAVKCEAQRAIRHELDRERDDEPTEGDIEAAYHRYAMGGINPPRRRDDDEPTDACVDCGELCPEPVPNVPFSERDRLCRGCADTRLDFLDRFFGEAPEPTDAGVHVPPTLDDEAWHDTDSDRREAWALMAWREAWADYERWADQHDRFGEYDLPESFRREATR